MVRLRYNCLRLNLYFVVVFFCFFRYDYIAVYDVLENQVGERYCGSITRPINKHVRGNVAVVIFRSDSTNSKKGFSLSYKASKSRSPPEIKT